MSPSLPSPKSEHLHDAGAPASKPIEAPAAKATRRVRIGAWFAVLVWSGVIWQLGGEDFSAPETRSTLITILKWLGLDLGPQTQNVLLTVVRKAAHCVEYGILALLVSVAVRVSSIRTSGAGHAENQVWPAISALGFVLALAIADETRQSGSVSRTGSPYDVMLDLGGGLLAIAGLAILNWLKPRSATHGSAID